MTCAPPSSGLLVIRLVSLVSVVIGASACREPPPETSGECSDGWQDVALYEAPEAVGNLACFDAGEELISGGLEAACQTEVTVVATMLDYQGQEAVEGARLVALSADDFGASELTSGTSAADGTLELTLPACTPLVYKSEREGALDTWGPHLLVDPTEPVARDYQSVAEGSKSLLELTFQVEIQEGNGSLVGVVRDCDGEPLEGAQVLVRDAECNLPSSWVPGYFTNQLPDVFRASTSADGVWAGMDVPPGEYVLEAYISAGEGSDDFVLLGSAPVTAQADAVVIVDIQPGRSDGVDVPDGCRGCE